MPMIPKPKKVVLQGKEKHKLREKIFDRSDGLCVVCGRQASEWHHEKLLAGLRSDRVEEGVALCSECHYKRHNTGEGNKIRNKIIDYLTNLYPNEWEKK